MVVLIFDAGPLIHLGKVRILEKLEKIGTKRFIPKTVYMEVVKEGKSIGEDDAFYIERLIEKGIFKVVEVKKTIKTLPTTILSTADQEVLSLAKKKNCFAVIDEDAGRKVAEIIDIKTIGSIGILFNLLKSNNITKKEMKNIIDKMIENGWFCSTALYSFILDKLYG